MLQCIFIFDFEGSDVPVADCILDLPGISVKIKICQSEWDRDLGVCILICPLFGQGYVWLLIQETFLLASLYSLDFSVHHIHMYFHS